MWRRLFGIVVSLFLNLIKQPLLLWKNRSSASQELPTTTGELELSPAEVPPAIIIEQQQEPPRQEANVELELRPAGELPTTSTTTGELEADVGTEEPAPIVVIEQQPPRQANLIIDYTNMLPWALLVMGVCFTAVGTALQAFL
ncbi:hypothetical protein ACH5RR_025434 [Cinchona calisaya]|uniref:Uncharacterized protein n=1 Tax=Cinchona calisaya TaxID=153742 RepID=A0ABD2Z3N2_9GENT